MSPGSEAVHASRPRPSPRPPLAVDLALLVMCVFWATNMVALKWMLGILPPPVLSAVRFLIITAVALTVLAVCRGPWRVARRDWPRVAASGLLGVTLYQIIFMEGLLRTTAFVSNLMQGTEPLWALFLLRLTGTARVSARQWGGVLVALLGAVLFFLPGAGKTVSSAVGPGDFLNLASALVFAAYGLVSGPLFARYPGRTAMGFSMAAGTVPLVLWSWPALRGADWSRVSPALWGALTLSALLPIYVGFWIWNWAVSRKGLAHASLYIFVDILLTGVFAYLFLGERFGPARLVGAAVILAGIHLARQGEEA